MWSLLTITSFISQVGKWRLRQVNGLPRWLNDKESTCQCRRHYFHPWEGNTPWRKKWQSTPLILPGKFHGQKSLVGYSLWSLKESDSREHAHTRQVNKPHSSCSCKETDHTTRAPRLPRRLRPLGQLPSVGLQRQFRTSHIRFMLGWDYWSTSDTTPGSRAPPCWDYVLFTCLCALTLPHRGSQEVWKWISKNV